MLPGRRGVFGGADQREPFDCIVSDVRMPSMSGLDLMQHLNRRGTARPVILITGHGDVDMAVGAIKNGAFDFIEKPFDEARLLASIRDGTKRAGQSESTAAEVDELQIRVKHGWVTLVLPLCVR